MSARVLVGLMFASLVMTALAVERTAGADDKCAPHITCMQACSDQHMTCRKLCGETMPTDPAAIDGARACETVSTECNGRCTKGCAH